MSGQSTPNVVSEERAHTSKEDMSLEEKIGMAKKFDREMKDYAKATVKEFLGIYGYEEDVDINMDESDPQKANETSTSTRQATEKQTESSTSTDCHNLHGNKLERVGPGQVKAVVMIDLDTFDSLDTSEVSEISIANIEGTSRSGNGDSVTNSELASDEVRKLACSPERLLSDSFLEMSQSEAESVPTALEVLDAISQIIPRSQPVLQEHSYATTDGALLPATADQNLHMLSSSDSTICQPVDMQQSSDIPTENVQCSNATSPNSRAGSSLIPNSQSTLLDISNSFEEAMISSRCQPNLEQYSVSIALSTGSDEMLQTDISTVATDLNSSIESTQLPLSLTGNTNEIGIIQPQNVESYATIQRTDDISLSTAPLNIRTNHAQPNEIHTATLLVSSIIQALQTQTNVSISEFSLKTVPSQHAKSSPFPELDNARSCERQRRLLDSSVKLSVALQSPVIASLSDCSLEAGRVDTSSGSSRKDAPDSKEKNSTEKEETCEKHDEKLKIQHERVRLRRSQENETKREERREKDRKRQQLKRARGMGKGKDSLHIASQTQEKGPYPVKQRKVAEDIPPEARSSEDTGFENDSNVTNTNNAATPAIDSAAPFTTKDFDMHRKIDCLSKQILHEISKPTTSQKTSGLCTSQQYKGIPDQELTPKITTILPGQKPSLPEDGLDLSKSAKVFGEDATVREANSSERNDSSSKKQAGDVKDEWRLSEKDKSRERMRKRRALESPAQRKARQEQQRERARKRRAEETDSQRETRRIKDRIRQQRKRTAESEENRSKRLTQQKEATRRRRELETPQEKQDRLMKDRVRARKSRESKRAGQNTK